MNVKKNILKYAIWLKHLLKPLYIIILFSGLKLSCTLYNV